MSRIQATFERLARERRKALIPYITAGDPQPRVTVPLMHALTEAGADVIEVGVPFSDPMADGPVIQRSGERALKHRVGLDQVVARADRAVRGREAHDADEPGVKPRGAGPCPVSIVNGTLDIDPELELTEIGWW